MKARKLESEETIEYLREILSGRAVVCNPMNLKIPGFGKVTATSQINYHVNEGNIIPYFTFTRDKKVSGEFFREENKYFVKITGINTQ